MAASGRDAGVGLVDVSGSQLADLAQFDDAILDDALARLLPARPDSGDRSCDGTASRLWQNY